MLLTWIHQPERFSPRQPVADLLKGMNREALVALVTRLSEQIPELYDTIEFLRATPVDSSNAAVDGEIFRKRVRTALDRVDPYEWGGDGDLMRHLASLERVVNRYADAANWTNAAVTARVLAQEVLEWLTHYRDDTGEAADILVTCDSALGRCLAAQASLPPGEQLPEEERKRLVETLYDLWYFDVADAGGMGAFDEGIGALIDHTTDDERARIERWLTELVPAAGCFAADWINRAKIGFIEELREPGPEELLALYENAGLWSDVAALHLELGHVDRAVAVARYRLEGTGLAQFASKLAGVDEDRAITLVDDHLWETEGANPAIDAALREWLAARYAARGRGDDAVRLLEKQFRKRPDMHAWMKVRDLALGPGMPEGMWAAARERMLPLLKASDQAASLIDVYLLEGMIREALDERKRAGWSPGGAYADMRLAEAAEADYPDEAIEIYMRYAERAISMRSRPSYAKATTYLARVRETLARHDRSADWPAIIGDIRSRYPTLPALRDELAKAGL